MTPRRRLVITLALLIGTFLASLEVTVLGTAMPSIVAQLGGLPLYGWVFAGYLLTSTTTTPLFGKVADRWGRRRAYLLATGLFLVASVLCAQAKNMEMLVVGRLLQGVGGGGLIPITMTVLGDIYSPAERARMQGVVALVWGLSSVVGPAVGALILKVATWPWIFYVNVPVGGVAAMAVWFTLQEEVEPSDKPMDVKGALLLTGTIASLLLGIQLLEGGRASLSAPLVALSVGLGVAFVAVERKAADPVMPLSLFKDAAIRSGVIASFFIAGILFSVITYAPVVVRGVHGRDVLAIAAALIPMSLAWSTGSFLGGRIFVRLGYRTAVRAGAALAFVGAACFTLTTREGAFWLMVPVSAITGVGFGLTFPTLNVVAQDRVAWQQRGAATALMQFSRSIGGAVWVAVAGIVLTSRLRAGLGDDVDADTLSLVLDPDQWGRLEVAFRVQAREALASALFWTLALLAGVGGVGALVLATFPDVKMGDAREGEEEA